MKTKKALRPNIVLTETDAERLAGLAEVLAARMPDVADAVMAEIDRAKVVPDGKIPDDAVRMGSSISYESGGTVRDVTLVFPGEADIGLGKISVMTPIGAALLGMRSGNSITYSARDGREQVIKVVSVAQPQAAPALV